MTIVLVTVIRDVYLSFNLANLPTTLVNVYKNVYREHGGQLGLP